MNQTDTLIEKIYQNESKPAAYLGPEKIYKVLQNQGYATPGIHKIRKWIQKQDDYSLQKPVRRNFKRAKIIVSDRNEQLDIDLADMQSLAKENDQVKYLLVTIDVFSRFVWIKP